MGYIQIEIDREALTIMGVPFPDLVSLERSARAITSNMYEGFEPTPDKIALYRDYVAGKISMASLPSLIKELR
jgi:hypothetical protein